MNKQEIDIQELEKQYIEMGGNPTHAAFKSKLAEAQTYAIEQHNYELSQMTEIERKRPKWAKDAGELAGKGLSLVATLFTFLFVLGGLFIGTIVLIAAELTAVYVGFAVMDSTHALLYSVALVLFYVVVLFIQEMILDKRGYTPQKQFSLKLLWEDMLYFFGHGDSWQLRYTDIPSAQRSISTTVKLSTWAIIIFGVLGRLEGKIAELSNLRWYEALQSILLDSKLSDFVGYFGMFIATAALLWSTKWIVVFIYEQFRRVTGGVIVQDFSSASIVIQSPAQRLEAVKRQVLTSEILRLEARNRKDGF